MISNAILFLVYVWISGIGALIDLGGYGNVTANASIVSGVSTAGGYLNVIYSIVPITTIAILGVLVPLLLFEGGLAGYKLIKWGYQKIPGIT